jgi:hypothetical protein
VVTGTCASCSVSATSPPSDVVPKPTIASIVAGAHSDAPPAPTTRAGVFVDGVESSSSAMS